MFQTRSKIPFILLGILVGLFAISTVVLAVILARNSKKTGIVLRYFMPKSQIMRKMFLFIF
jgi:hypothetical protein